MHERLLKVLPLWLAGLVLLCHAALAAKVEWEPDAMITRADLASPHRPR
jgi:hypothetical protein